MGWGQDLGRRQCGWQSCQPNPSGFPQTEFSMLVRGSQLLSCSSKVCHFLLFYKAPSDLRLNFNTGPISQSFLGAKPDMSQKVKCFQSDYRIGTPLVGQWSSGRKDGRKVTFHVAACCQLPAEPMANKQKMEASVYGPSSPIISLSPLGSLNALFPELKLFKSALYYKALPTPGSVREKGT